ncbi:MAG: chemotaxis protein CheB [Rhodobacteraceae bacterium]|jgi:two-component system CheB/CheR fusion protein|uniref:Two-component system, chemotaxis family, CheB/CheR fusion protein n=1 Tax=Salipiger profundus TaxID=1229727 RepID=A0A1U7D8J7_9RHOB|nr:MULTISPECIES: chemotaxis protein CheB [Salipiger]APX24438.1 two-component system, chemotaxis family, CheB/CheR fusion protein [Salipiger profundus]MAB07261.1 chemotaxis protein CheB [Paracoccaceae bacterium]GGA19970.1 chemotaxis protein CheR [Salipiger profundus]
MKDDDQTADTQTEEEAERLCIVGIGASAGGLEAIREMLGSTRADNNLAYVVVQHLDPNHESLLAELLSRYTELNVMQVSGGESIEAGNVYIIPPGHGLSVRESKLELTEFAQPRGLRRPIDDFFESLAVDQGRFAACVILSGTGADGSAGLRAIKEHGGLCIVQDPRTAKYDGMPTSAQNTGLVDFVRPPGEIVEAIRQFYAHASVGTVDKQLANTVERHLSDICTVVRNFVGHDFAGYKQSTLVRRVQRRIQVLDLSDAGQYLAHIRSDPHECELLFRDLLINVTRFFRDSEHFEALRELSVKPLVQNAGNGDEIRVWVPGCSSGEEAYSIAMLFAEECRLQKRSVNIQIFATDIDEQMLRLAREASYPQAALGDIPEGMRDLYTIARDGQFRMSARIRDMIRFSVHSIVRDPPFSNIDLLSCRNLLIYFGDGLQKTALPIFHYAIKPGGTLFLGPSETVGRYDHAFQPLDQTARVFQRNNGRPEYPLHLRGRETEREPSRRRPAQEDQPSTRLEWGDGGASERLLAQYAPPSLRVSPAGEILKSTGRLGKYLDFSQEDEGARFAPSVARPGVREPVSAIIRQVTQNKSRAISRGLEAQSEFGKQSFDLIAEPLSDGTILLIFRDRDRFEPLDEDEFEELEPMDSHVQSLEDELRATRVRLHTTVEELETANEELKSSNEEMMSMNEELQSTNEELSTVNDELKGKVDELSVANADLSNFFASTALPLVVVDRDMAIRNFTDAIQSIYPFRNTDRGRPLVEVTSTLRQNDEVLGLIRDVMDDGEIRHLSVTDRAEDRTWSLVVTPYRARDGALDGATLVFTEVTNALRLEEALNREGERLRLALDVSSLGVWEADPAREVLKIDGTGANILSVDEGELPLHRFLALITHEDRERVSAALAAVENDGDGIDVTFRLAGTGPRFTSVQLVGKRVQSSRTTRVLGVLFDVTSEQEARSIRDMMLREMNHRVKNMFSIISGMVRIAGRSSETVEDLVESIQSRVNALARSHDMTQPAMDGRNLMLEDAVRATLEPYEGQGEWTVGGPPLPVARHDLTALSLLLHEWATNAAKYGVLGPAPGRLEVTWSRGDDGEITLTWNEIHDREVVPGGEGSGFGSTLIQLSAAQLNGKIAVDYENNARRMTLSYAPEAGL